MSVHVSVGLLPHEPVCKFHGRTMELTPADLPLFQTTNARTQKTWRTKRKIYRCRIKGCPVVANGPSESFVTEDQRQRYHIPHYKEPR